VGKRVYEIARELDLSTKEVIGRLNDAGIEVESHFAVVEDPLVERVFGEGPDGAAPNGRSGRRKPETLPYSIQSQRKRIPMRRVLAYILAAALAFAVAAGVGAMAALILRGDLSLPGTEEPQQLDEQQNASRSHENEHAAQQPEKAASQQNEAGEQENAPRAQEQEGATGQSEAEYVAKVGEIQRRSVETFLDSHEMLMRYDALTADDVEQMQANQAALEELADQVEGLDPPQKYGEQHEVFRSAINELYEATGLAYELAADPIAASQSEFDEHDRHVDQAAADLERSNEILGRDYKTIEGARMEEISPF
jgi:Translation initiation factor IF-2, N-terminal region